MTSPLHDKRYQIFLEELRALRKTAGLSQKELESKLGLSQDLISRSE
jgi:transcriptional regulator with XRE-family HTH domain